MLGVFGMADRPGFYVDVGAHHPSYLSNTKLLNLRGWCGVNIDGNPNSVAQFQAARPGDRNVHAVVSDEPVDVTFTIFRDGAISTADPTLRDQTLNSGRDKVAQSITLRARSLADILAECVPDGQRIDLMSVDVEGFDLKVLRSNDWNRFTPFFLLVEDHNMSLLNGPNTEIFHFLRPLGYRMASQAFITSIYVRDQVPGPR
jgi:FkbM family methyltransferase